MRELMCTASVESQQQMLAESSGIIVPHMWMLGELNHPVVWFDGITGSFVKWTY